VAKSYALLLMSSAFWRAKLSAIQRNQRGILNKPANDPIAAKTNPLWVVVDSPLWIFPLIFAFNSAESP
jgi:hypothetical protein